MDDSGADWPIDTLPTEESYGPGAPAGPEHGVYPPLRALPDAAAHAGRQPAVRNGPVEHPSYEPHRPIHDVYAAPMPMPRRRPMPGVPEHQQAVGADGSSSSGSLGLTILALAVGVGVGAKNAGLPGAAAGGLLAGSAVNAVRSFRAYRQGTEAGNKEGRVAAFYGLLGAVGGGWLWVKYGPKRSAGSLNLWPFTKNGDGDEEHESGWRQDKIRRVGP